MPAGDLAPIFTTRAPLAFSSPRTGLAGRASRPTTTCATQRLPAIRNSRNPRIIAARDEAAAVVLDYIEMGVSFVRIKRPTKVRRDRIAARARDTNPIRTTRGLFAQSIKIMVEPKLDAFIDRGSPRLRIVRRRALLFLLHFTGRALSLLAPCDNPGCAFLKLELANFAQNFWRLRAIERSTERTNTFVDSAHSVTSSRTK